MLSGVAMASCHLDSCRTAWWFHAKAAMCRSAVIQDQINLMTLSLRNGVKDFQAQIDHGRIQVYTRCRRGNADPGLTPTAAVQAGKQLPEDLLRSFAVRIGQRGASPQPHLLQLLSSCIFTRSLKLCCPVNCPKKRATNCPQHVLFRTPLSPWWRSTMARPGVSLPEQLIQDADVTWPCILLSGSCYSKGGNTLLPYEGCFSRFRQVASASRPFCPLRRATTCGQFARSGM